MYEQIAKSKDWLYPIFRIYVMIPSVKQKETGADRLTMVPTREFAWIFVSCMAKVRRIRWFSHRLMHMHPAFADMIQILSFG